MIILAIQEPKEQLPIPDGAEHFFVKEKIPKPTITVLTVDEVKTQLLNDKPERIFSLTYSNEDPFFECEEYDDEGVNVRVATYESKAFQPLLWEDFYKLLKKEGLKTLVY